MRERLEQGPARIVRVIELEVTRGAGTPQDPVRNVTQYLTLGGQWLAEFDPCAPDDGPSERLHFVPLSHSVV